LSAAAGRFAHEPAPSLILVASLEVRDPGGVAVRSIEEALSLSLSLSW